MDMLWRKAWLETRWRFAIGFAVLACMAAGAVLGYPQVKKLLPLVADPHVMDRYSGELGRRLRESAGLVQTFRGFVWVQWIRQNSTQMITLFAALLGTAGVTSASRGGLFTLSLPVSRRRLAGTRAATGLAELAVIAFVPPLVFPVLAPAIGESYDVADSLAHGLCMFAAAVAVFELAFLLSTAFDDRWKPLLVTLGIAIGVGLAEYLTRLPFLGVFHVMTGESWFHEKGLPWIGILALAAAGALLHWGAVWNFRRRDF
jgi:hypothetical protein